MLAFAFYLLKVIICSGILFGYYWLTLRNKIFHQYNRFYLLGAVVLSLSFPLIQIDIWHNADSDPTQAIKLLQVVNNSDAYLDEMAGTARVNNISTEQAMLLIYGIITLGFLFFFIYSLIKIHRLFIQHRHQFVEQIFLIKTTTKGTPFSFFNYIFWNDNIDPESLTGNRIFKHELAHVRQKHSYDKLFINATLVIFWANPFYWLIRKELNMIHEFVADKIAVEDSDTEAFAAMVLQATYPQHRFNLSNPFFYSPIKRRLMMLTKNKHTKAGYIGRLLVLPLALFVFAAFTLKAKTFKADNGNYIGKQITVVVDAGHGGGDMGAISLQGKIAEKEITLAIARKIASINTNKQLNVLLTRDADIDQSLANRVAITKNNKADLFISIHVDATKNATANGMSIWVARDNFSNTNSSKILASALIHELGKDQTFPVLPQPQQREMGIKVLQEAVCPAVLIEAGNISNEKDLAYLQSPAGIETIARKILAAVETYANEKQPGKTTLQLQPVKDTVVTKTKDTVPVITLKSKQQPLIILDGKTINHELLNKIDPDNIESVNVLKEAAAIKKYGEKAKYGVVIVTTRPKKVKENAVTKIIVRADTVNFIDKTPGNDIKVRGYKAQPLYVVNGKIQPDDFDIQTILPENIESINVLKDQHGIDKYGKEAVNGVVEIKTKDKAVLETTEAKPTGKPFLKEVIVVGYGSDKSAAKQ